MGATVLAPARLGAVTTEWPFLAVAEGRDPAGTDAVGEDTGLGIPHQQAEAIFERFRQVGDTLTGKPEGAGLGLPISREIVQHHGGTLTVRSAPGQGSCFRMTLPLAG